VIAGPGWVRVAVATGRRPGHLIELTDNQADSPPPCHRIAGAVSTPGFNIVSDMNRQRHEEN